MCCKGKKEGLVRDKYLGIEIIENGYILKYTVFDVADKRATECKVFCDTPAQLGVELAKYKGFPVG